MSNAEPKNRPAYRLYSVMKNGEKKSTWTEIGAAFGHKDQKGFSLMFTARPLEGSQIVLRQPKGEVEPPTMLGRYDALKAELA